MTSRVVGLVLVVTTAAALLSACDLREGTASEYGSMTATTHEQTFGNTSLK